MRRVVLAALPVLLAGCAGSPSVHHAQVTPRALPTTTMSQSPTTSPKAVRTTVPAHTVPTPTFSFTVSAVTPATVRYSYHPGCPIGPSDLRLLRVSYWGFDDRPHVGVLVVRDHAVPALRSALRTLFDARFPIRRMQLVDDYKGDDNASMAADNTSAFNCRNAVATGPAHWSEHAYGEAIDINPIENPYLEGGKVLPPAGSAYVDRSHYRPGMVMRGGLVVRAFADVGWGWGGNFSDPDFQHFSATGH